jgi:hypothetical protein
MSSFVSFLLADELAKAGYQPVGVSRLVAAKACARAGATSLAEMVGMNLGQMDLPAKDKQTLQVNSYINAFVGRAARRNLSNCDQYISMQALLDAMNMKQVPIPFRFTSRLRITQCVACAILWQATEGASRHEAREIISELRAKQVRKPSDLIRFMSRVAFAKQFCRLRQPLSYDGKPWPRSRKNACWQERAPARAAAHFSPSQD